MTRKREDTRAARPPRPTTTKQSPINDPLVPRDIVNEILPTKYRLKCKNYKQKEFSNLITDKEIVIATGPAGVGKSYVAIARAFELLQNTSNQYKHIVLINPAVEAEEKYGFMPGTLREKLDPFVGSSIDIIDKIVGVEKRIKLEEEGVIVVGALGFIRGKTIDNTILIMEEAQNMSPHQMKTLLTRIGANSKFIISGDLDQSDRYSDYKQSGLYDVVNRHKNIDQFGFMVFNESDIVRNPLITLILNNYKKVEEVINPKLPEPPKSRIIKEGGIIPSQKKNKSRLMVRLKLWFRKNFKW
jgi:phosphate starvation-inducible PhoH-like protein